MSKRKRLQRMSDPHSQPRLEQNITAPTDTREGPDGVSVRRPVARPHHWEVPLRVPGSTRVLLVTTHY